MNKRTFLLRGAALLAAGPVTALAQSKPHSKPRKPAPAPVAGPALLTVTGAISRSNRGATDPALDPLFNKLGIHFDKAWTLSWPELAAMPSNEIRTTLAWDGKVHTLQGPYLAQLLATAGAATRDGTKVLLRGLDGTNASISLGDLRKYRYIVATHMDGQPLALGGLGPLWAVYAADQFAEITARPLAERYLNCPYALFHIEVQTG
ncbi:molybdopterin-dependent oxidoreductase [Amantichitinum ursilacus]|nr:molybdopterin-dependent oxidoreductase [Amantichitinum ursilacus]